MLSSSPTVSLEDETGDQELVFDPVFLFQVSGFLSDAIIQSCRVSLGDRTGDHELFFDPLFQLQVSGFLSDAII